MRKLRAFLIRCFTALTARHSRHDADAELEAHLGFHVEDGMRSGLSYEEARRQALVKLGGFEQTRQAMRERRSMPSFENLVRDLRYSLRTFLRHKAVTVIAIVSIGLGVGANATIFSMLSRFLLRPAPMGDPTTLLALHTTHEGDHCCNPFSLPLYEELRDHAKSFSGVAAYYELIPASVGGSGEPERVWGQGVTANYFSVTELPMQLGRGFATGEDNAPEVVIGSALWRRRFNADPEIVGKSVLISGHSYTVVGVVTPAFHGADQILYTEFWVPLGNLPQLVANLPDPTSADFHWVAVLARLAPGVTRPQAAAELHTMAARFSLSHPEAERKLTIVFEQAGSLPSNVAPKVALFFTALAVVALLVLAIAGANVANLLFAQAASRQRDMALRLAIGATRGRLRRQLLMESLLLGLGGGLLGVLLSFWSTKALSSVRLPAPVPIDVAVAVDWRVVLYSLGVSVLCGLLLGIAPAWAASRPQLANALRGEDALARPGRRFTLRNLLVIAQIAMSVMLLSVTGLFLRSLESAARIDIGFSTHNLLMASVDPRVHGYTGERTAKFLSALRQKVAALPGVDSAVVTDLAPLTDGNRSDGFTAVDQSAGNGQMHYADLYMVTPGYFETLGIPRLAGRDFGAETASGPRTAVVNREFVQSVFGGANPIGQHVAGGSVTYQIVGVVGNAKSRSLGEETRAILYRSLDQSIASDPSLMGYTLIVHAAGDSGSIQRAVRMQIHSLDPALAIYNEESMDEHMHTAYFLPRFAATLFGVFGFIGLTLTAVGLYGVMSYSVTRRTREIGIRIAMGAQRGVVERFILRQGLVLTLIALALGWPAAWFLARLASSALYGIQPHDALTFATTPLFLGIIAVAACWIPARRAASINPTEALRAE
jgi:predicted permease